MKVFTKICLITAAIAGSLGILGVVTGLIMGGNLQDTEFIGIGNIGSYHTGIGGEITEEVIVEETIEEVLENAEEAVEEVFEEIPEDLPYPETTTYGHYYEDNHTNSHNRFHNGNFH